MNTPSTAQVDKFARVARNTTLSCLAICVILTFLVPGYREWAAAWLAPNPVITQPPPSLLPIVILLVFNPVEWLGTVLVTQLVDVTSTLTFAALQVMSAILSTFLWWWAVGALARRRAKRTRRHAEGHE